MSAELPRASAEGGIERSVFSARPRRLVDPRGRHLTLSRSGEIAIVDMDGRELSTHRVPYGAHLLCESGRIHARCNHLGSRDDVEPAFAHERIEPISDLGRQAERTFEAQPQTSASRFGELLLVVAAVAVGAVVTWLILKNR